MVLTVLALGAAPATSALAWGDEGHEVIALIARSYLAPVTLMRVDEILSADREGSGASGMAAAATWADRWRSMDRSTAGWHYTDLQLDDPDMAQACDTARSCAVAKVGQFAQTLADAAAAPAERLFALKMVLHLVGDLHQPLHAATARVGGRLDAGGNCETVSLAGASGAPRVLSLHAYWDDVTVSSLGADPVDLARRLRAGISRAQIQTWSTGGPADWTWQSHQIAERLAYRYGETPRCGGPPAALSAAYQTAASATTAEQLQRAGVRLAVLLNENLRR